MIERPSELQDPSSLRAAYARLANLIGSDFDWAVTGEPALATPADFEAWEAKLLEILDRESRSKRTFAISVVASIFAAATAAAISSGSLVEILKSLL